MVTKVVPGLLIATPDAAQAAKEACARIIKYLHDAIAERGSATIALSGGDSPIDAYRMLAKAALDWSKVHVFWVDERAVDPSHERSNFGQAKKVLLDPAAVPTSNIHRMRAEAPDLEAAARDYEALVRQKVEHEVGNLPSIDVLVMGIGNDGHTASLFPGEPTVRVTDRLVAAVPAAAAHEARMTLTAPLLENARASVFLVLGKDKHAALERIWATQGELGETPARVVRHFRGAICWVIDRAAGGMG